MAVFSRSTIIGLGLLVSTALSSQALAADVSIALANNDLTNAWRIRMVDAWNAVAEQAQKDGLISKTKVLNANASTPQQASQIENLVVEGWSAIAMNSPSPTALNGVIEEACANDIIIVTFDQTADAPCAYKVSVSFETFGRLEAEYIVKRLNGKGNVLIVHGVAGQPAEVGINTGAMKVFEKYPDIKIVGEVYGNWVNSIAQKEVAGILPTLPDVDAVIAAGGPTVGVIQAFRAAGKKVPIVTMGNYQDELALWKELTKQPGGYETMSLSGDPAISQAAFWIAEQIKTGRKVPKQLEFPLLPVNQEDLDAWLKVTPVGGVASANYSREWISAYLDAIDKGTAVPKAEIPTEAAK